MRDILRCWTSLGFSYLSDCVGTFISFTGSPRLCPLYLELSRWASPDFTDTSKKADNEG